MHIALSTHMREDALGFATRRGCVQLTIWRRRPGDLILIGPIQEFDSFEEGRSGIELLRDKLVGEIPGPLTIYVKPSTENEFTSLADYVVRLERALKASLDSH